MSQGHRPVGEAIQDITGDDEDDITLFHDQADEQFRASLLFDDTLLSFY